MRDQVPMPFPRRNPARQITPTSGRSAPLVWVRRIRVLDVLEPGDDHVVRDVELRLGLNIVWAPPSESAGGNALFQPGVSGHTAGKTTFCRLIRHVLGERTLASEATRRRIRQHFPSGWVLAEVVLVGRSWVVARPLGLGARPFCLPDARIDEALGDGKRCDYQTFLDALDDATTTALPAKRFPTSDEPVRWEHLLPWLARDQECRFSDFLEWRHSTSDSQAPALTVDERQFLVRSVLALISDDERTEQQRNARLVAEKKRAAERAPLLAHQATVDHGRVQELLGAELPPPSAGLFGQLARQELARRQADLDRRMQAHADADPRGATREALERAIAAESSARRDVEEARGRLELETVSLSQLDATVRGEEQDDLLAGLPPPRDYCNVPLSLAREKGCPLARSRPYELGARRAEQTAAEELEDLRAVVDALQQEVTRTQTALRAAEQRTREARRAFFAAATEYDEQRGKLLEEQAQLRQVERLVGNAERAWRASEELTKAVKTLSSEIEDSYKQQEAMRAQVREALGRFSATFDYVARALLGDEVEAKVDTSGRSLALVVDHHGERDSAALGTVKLLAFDLAAITASIEGQGSFPRLLIHDGPREADMAPEVYERLFLYAWSLEECFEEDPGFQYIVTTTTPPPKRLLAQPWMRLRLGGTPAEERLLGCDL